MKILAIICEFNPFHNGHKYLLETATKLYEPDAVVCIMSGDFTQRGQMCVMDKYTRAKHAIEGGADCVIQLPSPFAVAPAEVFAKGAIKILSSIPQVAAISFGCEDDDKYSYFKAAKLLLEESEKFKDRLNYYLSSGNSYIKSYANAFADCGGDTKMLSTPNNILGVEYTKAIVRSGANIDILPVKRVGAQYNDCDLKQNYSSASAIRNNLTDKKAADNVPEFVYKDFSEANGCVEYETVLRHSLFNSSGDNLKKIYACTEGLENKLKSLQNCSLEQIIERATSRRYSSSRIMRILCANALGLYASDCEKYLGDKLYIKPLAVRKGDEILSELAKSKYPIITGIDDKNLTPCAKQCFEADRREFALYNLLTRSDRKDYMILV